MTEDEGFLRALLARPGDTTTRLVYADWLEERGDRRGEFLRLEVRLAELGEGDERAAGIRDRLLDLRQGIDPGWLARLDRTKIDRCALRFAYRCPLRWENLRPTRDPTQRYCAHCLEIVFHCSTLEEAREHARQGDCVAVDSRLTRTANDLPEEEMEEDDLEMGELGDDLEEDDWDEDDEEDDDR